MVNLNYKNHILAHYYLCLCYGSLKDVGLKLECSFFFSTNIHPNHFNVDETEKYNEIYNRYILNKSKERKGIHFSPNTEYKKGQKPNKKAIEKSLSPESIAKRAAKLIGRPSWNKDKKMSIEYRERCRKTNIIPDNRKPIYRCDMDWNIIDMWSCATEAGRILNISFQNISKSCYGKRNTAGGYRWCFVKKYKEKD